MLFNCLKNIKISWQHLCTSAFNLWGKTAHITATNSVFGNAGQSSFAGTIGGKYNFKHCTFANYWNKGFRTTPAVLLNDYALLVDGNNFIKPLTEATFENCIIEGNQFVEFYIEQEGSDAVNFYLNHTAIQFESSNTSIINNPFFDLDIKFTSWSQNKARSKTP